MKYNLLQQCNTLPGRTPWEILIGCKFFSFPQTEKDMKINLLIKEILVFDTTEHTTWMYLKVHSHLQFIRRELLCELCSPRNPKEMGT